MCDGNAPTEQLWVERKLGVLGPFLGEILKRSGWSSSQGHLDYLFWIALPGFTFSLVLGASPWSFSLVLGPYDVFNLLEGTPACSLTSAGHWESETVWTWLPKFDVFTASSFRFNWLYNLKLKSCQLVCLFSILSLSSIFTHTIITKQRLMCFPKICLRCCKYFSDKNLC